MQRHLLPNEIDLLLDGESGFGVAPLQAHVAGCGSCRARLEQARTVVVALDGLGRHAPRPGFADRVLNQVQVVQPLHVAVADAARQVVPASRWGRLAAAGLLATAGLSLSGAVVWLATRADLALYAGQLLADRARDGLWQRLGQGVQLLLGAEAVDAVRLGGAAALTLGVLVMGAGVALSVIGLRRLAKAHAARS